MKAVRWHGKHKVSVDRVPDPHIVNARDAIVRVSLAAICGSDLHLYDGYIPSMKDGDILGHEFIGEVVEVGPAVKNLLPGDRVVVPFTISCGNCFYCKEQMWSLCDNSNPNSSMEEKLYGDTTAGIFGYSHLYGGYAGGQAEYVRVPYADVGPLKLPAAIADEKALFLGDIMPTAYMAAENCSIREGDTVAIWGAGPVGLLAMKCATMLGASRIIAIDRFQQRLKKAEKDCGAVPIDYQNVDVLDALDQLTGGRGPDSCIDAVGLEAHGTGAEALYDTVKQSVGLENDRPIALREAVKACRKGGTVSIPGVYGGHIDKFPIGSLFAKGLTIKAGQTHVQKYMPMLLRKVMEEVLDPSFIITHRMKLDDAPRAYEMFKRKEHDCVKIVLKPGTA
jgi:threonine dehydrogenase-like Zn-dependent dehydrogenase